MSATATRALCLACGLVAAARAARLAVPVPAEPGVVVAGIGNSGTTAVLKALQDLGMKYCSKHDLYGEPTWAHEHRENHIHKLLYASKGNLTVRGFKHNQDAFRDAVEWQKDVARQEVECLQKDFPSGMPEGSVWGFKEPHYTYLMPVMDEAFHGHTNYIIVARDPRDICSNWIQDQFLIYGAFFNVRTTDVHDCYYFWASFWSMVLAAYDASPRFKIVRIEDLVLPDPRREEASLSALRCALQHTGLQPSWSSLQSAQAQLYREGAALFDLSADAELLAAPPTVARERAERSLRGFHGHKAAYMGHHRHQDEAARRKLEQELAARMDFPVIHETMLRLGYNTTNFGLLKPLSGSVCQ